MTTVQLVASHRWRVPASPFEVLTDDDIRLRGTRLGDPDASRPALVAAHGLMGWHRKPRFAAFCERLSAVYTVFAPDLRGHGESDGVSDYGGAEIWDIEGVVSRAREEGHTTVVSLGTSMGAIAAVRHAGLIGGVEEVVAISCLAFWDWQGGAHPRVRAAFHARVRTSAGRAALRTWGVRLPQTWEPPEAPEEVAGKIAPTPLLVVHGRDDPLFAVEHAERLYAAASEPKRLLIGEPFGHAEDGLSPAFADRLEREIDGLLP